MLLLLAAHAPVTAVRRASHRGDISESEDSEGEDDAAQLLTAAVHVDCMLQQIAGVGWEQAIAVESSEEEEEEEEEEEKEGEEKEEVEEGVQGTEDSTKRDDETAARLLTNGEQPSGADGGESGAEGLTLKRDAAAAAGQHAAPLNLQVDSENVTCDV